MIDLLLVLASVAHLEEFFLLRPLLGLCAHLRRALLVHAPVVEVAGHSARLLSGTLAGGLVHVEVCVAVVHDIAHQRIRRMTGVLGTISGATERIIVDAERLLLFQLFLLLFNQLRDELLLVDLIISVDRVLLALLLHDED